MENQDMKVNVCKLGGVHGPQNGRPGRTILVGEPEVDAEGKIMHVTPVLVSLSMRPAESAPEGTRVKFALTMPGPGGEPAPLPVAQATLLPLPMPALVVESRMECN